jgi:hypothetical protein
MTCSSQRVLETRVISDFRPAHDILREEPLHPNSRAELYNTCREGSRMRMSTDISEAKAEYRCAAHSSSKCFCIVLLCSVSHTHTIHISKLPNTQTPYIPSKSLEINIHSLCSSTPPTQTCRLMGVDSFCFFALSSSIRAFLLYLFWLISKVVSLPSLTLPGHSCYPTIHPFHESNLSTSQTQNPRRKSCLGLRKRV